MEGQGGLPKIDWYLLFVEGPQAPHQPSRIQSAPPTAARLTAPRGIAQFNVRERTTLPDAQLRTCRQMYAERIIRSRGTHSRHEARLRTRNCSSAMFRKYYCGTLVTERDAVI